MVLMICTSGAEGAACSVLGTPCKVGYAENYNQCQQFEDCGCACQPLTSSAPEGVCVNNNNASAGLEPLVPAACPPAPGGQVGRTNLYTDCCEYTFGVAPTPPPSPTYSYSEKPLNSGASVCEGRRVALLFGCCIFLFVLATQ